MTDESVGQGQEVVSSRGFHNPLAQLLPLGMAAPHPTWNVFEAHYSRYSEAMVAIVAEQNATVATDMDMRKRLGSAEPIGW